MKTNLNEELSRIKGIMGLNEQGSGWVDDEDVTDSTPEDETPKSDGMIIKNIKTYEVTDNKIGIFFEIPLIVDRKQKMLDINGSCSFDDMYMSFYVNYTPKTRDVLLRDELLNYLVKHYVKKSHSFKELAENVIIRLARSEGFNVTDEFLSAAENDNKLLDNYISYYKYNKPS
jgi:hypothetical protein